MSTIVYVGNFEPPHSTENDYASAFESEGHTVFRVQENDPQAAFRAQRMLDGGAVDLFLYTRTWDAISPADWWEIATLAKATHTPTASVHLDLFHGVMRNGAPGEEMVARDPMFRLDHVFTADGDHEEEFAALGVNHHWLPPAVNEEACYFDRAPRPDWIPPEVEVAFVGARNYHPEHPRAELVDALAARYGTAFHRFAGDTAPDGHAYRGRALNLIYAHVPVIVGDGCLVRHDGRYWSDRVPETLGRGGRLIHPHIRRLCVDYMPSVNAGMLIGTGPDHEELFAHIAQALVTDVDDRLRRASIADVRERHTYRARVRTILATVGAE